MMKAKQILYCILVIAIAFGIRKIPLDFIVQSRLLAPYGENVRRMFLSVIIILLLLLIVKKYRIVQTGGFIHHRSRNYWTIMLPFFFPGILLFMGFSIDCVSDGFKVFVTFLTAIVLGVFEEVLFRGVILGYLIKHSPDKSYTKVIIVTSLLFALAHFVNLFARYCSGVFIQVIYSFYMGLLFGAILIKTNNVWLVGIVHGLINFISGICPTDTSLTEEVVPESIFWFLTWEIIKAILLFSPILLIYWALMKNTKMKKHVKMPPIDSDP